MSLYKAKPEMVLYFNTFITNKRLTNCNRGNLPNDDRLDVFKYMLASLAVIDRIESGIIRCELDDDYSHRWEELEQWVSEQFADKVKIYRIRAQSAEAWQDQLEVDLGELPDGEQVMFFCNDDHIFIDSTLDTLYSCLDSMAADPELFKAVVLSHWPEHLKVSVGQHASRLEEHDDFVTFYWASDDSYQVVTAALLRRWFGSLPRDYKGWLPRSDGMFWGFQPYKAWVPKRELVRHFDGYAPQGMCIGTAPPLTIPEGFFEGSIKIDVGGTKRRDGWTLFNSDMPVRTTHAHGADYKWVEEDIPLFWRGRIAEVERNRTNMYRGRNDAISSLATCDHNTNWTKGNTGVIPGSFYNRSHIVQDLAMIWYPFDTLTEDHLRFSIESLLQDDWSMDTLVLYNPSTQFSDNAMLKLLKTTGVAARFRHVEVASSYPGPKTVSADFAHQFISVRYHRGYVVVKPDFYFAKGSIPRCVELLKSNFGKPWCINFKKFDIRESAPKDYVRALAGYGDFAKALAHEHAKMWTEEPITLDDWAIGFFGPDGVTHAYTDQAAGLASVGEEERNRSWGYCSALESIERAGGVLAYDDRVYAMHIYHPVPAKTGPPYRMVPGHRY